MKQRQEEGTTQVPPGWTCFPEFFNASDGFKKFEIQD